MTTALAIIALFASLIALGVAIWNARSDTRSAIAAEASAISSDRSADAAKHSAESAAQVARAELARDHEMYRPQPTASGFAIEPNNTVQGRNWLIFTFNLPRSYRMDGRTQIDVGRYGEFVSNPSYVVEAGQQVKVYVEDLPDSKTEPGVKSVQLQFWPPQAGQAGEMWTCPCGRDTHPNGEPHWVWNVPVPPDMNYDIMKSVY